MKRYGKCGLSWDVEHWPGRRYVRLCCVRALLEDEHDASAGHELRVEKIDEPDTWVTIMRDHDLGDCDEQYTRVQ